MTLRTSINAILGCALALSTALAQTTTTTTPAPAPLIPFAPPSVSTVPTNGDVNPYGVAIAPAGLQTPTGGFLQPGDILVSNFNNSANQQGTGATIIRDDPQRHSSPLSLPAQPWASPERWESPSTAIRVRRAAYPLPTARRQP